MNEKTEFKCPFCTKTSNKKWVIVNHVRQSTKQGHGSMGKLPEGFNPLTLEYVKPTLNPDVKPTLNPEVKPSEVKPSSEDVKPPEVEPGVKPPEEVKPEVELVKPPEKKKTINKCPDCGSSKSDWISVNKVEDHGLNISKEEREEYDFVCLKCLELIKIS